MGYIYRIYNDVNDKSYIGLTSNTVETRWKKHLADSSFIQRHLYNAMRLYGVEHFFVETLEKIDDSKLAEREQHWIEQYDSYHNGYNETHGGEGRQLYSKNEFYQLWDKSYSVKEIALHIGCSRNTVRQALLDYENYSVERSLKRRVEGMQHRVCQFDLSGLLLNTFNSEKEAKATLGIKGNVIGLCCKRKPYYKTAKGYFWLWEKDKDKIDELVKSLDNGHIKRKVVQLDKDDNVIAIFNSATEAAQSFGQPKNSYIGECCKGKRKSYLGYRWRYER